MTAEVLAPFEVRGYQQGFEPARAAAWADRPAEVEAEEQRVRPLTGPWIAVIVVIGVLAGAIAVGGMILSFRAVSAEMTPAFGARWAWLVPIVTDLTVLVFSGVDLVLARMDMPNPLARLTVYAATAGTVYLNANAAGDLPGRVAHVLMPSIWVVFIELMRHVVRRQVNLSTGSHREPIPAARWALSPWPTLKLWRRMILWRTNSYRVALEMERARLGAIAVAREVRGRFWRWRVSPLLRLQIALGEVDVDGVLAALGAVGNDGVRARVSASFSAGGNDSGIGSSALLVPGALVPTGAADRIVPDEVTGSSAVAGSASSGGSVLPRPEPSTTPEPPLDPEQAELADLLKAAEAVPLHRGARSATRIGAELEVSASLAKHLATVLTANDEIAKLRSSQRSPRSHEVLLEQARAEFAGQATPSAEAIRRAIGCRAITARKLRDDLAELAEANGGLVPSAPSVPSESGEDARPAASSGPDAELVPAQPVEFVPAEDAVPTESEDETDPGATDETSTEES